MPILASVAVRARSKNAVKTQIWTAVCVYLIAVDRSIEAVMSKYPIIIHHYSLMTDSGGAGKFRGGSGTAWEVEPLDKEMLCIGFGEGRRIPAMGAAGARSTMIDEKVGRVEVEFIRVLAGHQWLVIVSPGLSHRSDECEGSA